MYNELQNIINEYEYIYIFRHKRPDPDAIASQLALKEYIQVNYNKKVFAIGDDDPIEFNYLGAMDKTEINYEKGLAIVVDTANYERIEGNNLEQFKMIIKIDHHIDEEHERYGTLNLVNSKMASTCEYLYYILKELNDNYNLKFNQNIAKLLFAGIYSDTGGFIFPSTTNKTFFAASKLVKYEFEYEELIMNLTTKNHEIMKLIGYAYQNIKINNGFGYLKFDQKFQTEHNIKPHDISIIANYLGNIKELKVWCVLNEYPKFIRANIRSREKYNVQEIAKKYNGGGHKNASGASLKDFEHAEMLIKELGDLIK